MGLPPLIATTLSSATGWFSFGKLAAGTYQLQYTPPPSQSLKTGTTGLTAPSTVVAGQNLVAPQGYMVTTTPGVTLGSGPDSIVVGLSEDAYQGNAQFTVSVDGTQIGGTQTATAIQCFGQTELYTLDGSFGPGTHAITVSST